MLSPIGFTRIFKYKNGNIMISSKYINNEDLNYRIKVESVNPLNQIVITDGIQYTHYDLLI